MYKPHGREPRAQDKINQISNKNDEENDKERELICAVHSTHSKYPELEFLVIGEKIKLRIDTLASINIIDENRFNQFKNRPNLIPVINPSFSYGSKEPIKTFGRYKTKLKINKKEVDTEFVVACGNSGSLIGDPTCSKLGVDPISQIVNSINDFSEVDHKQREYYKEKYPSLISGKIGCFKDFEIELHIDKKVKPVQANPRKIPFHLRQAVEDQLKIKLENDIIEEVENDPTTWLSETVKIPKKGTNEIRLCIDTKAVNEAILSEKYEMPTAEDIIYAANGMNIFSKADLNSAFEQIKLNKNSRHVVFRTHKGIFQYKRLFFGIKSAPEIFHKIIRKALEGIANVTNATDDILIMGKTQEDHDITLNLVFSRLEKKGFTLNIEKCVFSKSTVTFFGLILSNNSISLNEQKTSALRNASAPRNASELHSFLGLTVYASRWIKDLALISEPLWALLKNQALPKFEWTEKHQASFEKVKNNLIESVSYFDPTQVTVDASPHGLGGVLAQSHPEDKDKVRIMMYISRILTDTEKRYSQIEKEGLGVVW
ncbi:unnamed protein product, partial [Brachionus calyciflorus]